MIVGVNHEGQKLDVNDGVNPGMVVVDTSTVSRDTAREAAARLQEAKADFLDALAQTMVDARRSLSDTGGEITMRRLNRREYQNSIEYLTGVREIERRIEKAERFGPPADPGVAQRVDDTGDVAVEGRVAVVVGEEEECAEATKAALGSKSPMDVINEGLIPGMNEVSRLWDEGVYFLPQVILASDAMNAGT